jgi:hypothetical protein
MGRNYTVRSDVRLIVALCSGKIDNGCKNSSDNNPEELKPVKERDTKKCWVPEVIEWGPQHGNEGNENE